MEEIIEQEEQKQKEEIRLSFDQKIEKRVDELIDKAIEIERSKRMLMGDYAVDTVASQQWYSNCLSLISRLVGEKDNYYRSFKNLEKEVGRLSCLQFGLGILYALREDLKKGLLIHRDLYIAAEIYDDVLLQAYFLLGKKQKELAVLLMGTMLQSALRRICVRNGIYFNNKDEISALNERLRQAEIVTYNSLIYKKVIHWAEIQQRILQGESKQLEQKETEKMYKWLRFFLEKLLT